jgi:hypothetical protein
MLLTFSKFYEVYITTMGGRQENLDKTALCRRYERDNRCLMTEKKYFMVMRRK